MAKKVIPEQIIESCGKCRNTHIDGYGNTICNQLMEIIVDDNSFLVRCPLKDADTWLDKPDLVGDWWVTYKLLKDSKYVKPWHRYLDEADVIFYSSQELPFKFHKAIVPAIKDKE